MVLAEPYRHEISTFRSVHDLLLLLASNRQTIL